MSLLLKNPCYNASTHTQCPRRHAGCAAGCPDWDKYVVAREEQYKKRQHEKMTERPCYDLDERIEKDYNRRHNRRHFGRLKKG